MRPVTMVFQDHNLFAHLDVKTNVGLGISPALKLTPADHERIATALERVGLTGFEHRLPGQLSGGERQRVAIARALVRDKPVLLLDEPFAALGPALRREMLDLVAEIHREKAMTVLIVTHQPEDARHAASRTAFVHQGRILADAGNGSALRHDGHPRTHEISGRVAWFTRPARPAIHRRVSGRKIPGPGSATTPRPRSAGNGGQR